MVNRFIAMVARVWSVMRGFRPFLIGPRPFGHRSAIAVANGMMARNGVLSTIDRVMTRQAMAMTASRSRLFLIVRAWVDSSSLSLFMRAASSRSRLLGRYAFGSGSIRALLAWLWFFS